MHFSKVGNISDAPCGRIKAESAHNMIHCVWILPILLANDKLVGKSHLGGPGSSTKRRVMSTHQTEIDGIIFYLMFDNLCMILCPCRCIHDTFFLE